MIYTFLLLVFAGLDARVWAKEVLDSPYLYEWGFYGCKGCTVSLVLYSLMYLLSISHHDLQIIRTLLALTQLPTMGREGVWYRLLSYSTFWASPHGSTRGFGRGTYYMLDSSYQVFRKFEPVGDGLKGDLHDFLITGRDTVLMTVYNPVPADLSSVGGPEEGWALDCLFQEVGIETGELLFEWSAIEHVDLNECVRSFAGADDGMTPETAFDFFHINSVDVDDKGDYVVSGRHTSTVLGIDRQGDVLWTLGGRANDFADLSEGRATDFMYQHHVRVHDDSTLSIFDNAASERAGASSPHEFSRGLLVQLDKENSTARLLRQFYDPANPILPSSQGSMQMMNDRAVIGYGWLPFITEFALDSDSDSDFDPYPGPGSVMCHVELAPWVSARWGLVTTYRAFKATSWVGRPTDLPSVHLDPADRGVFVSWNGATEVDTWVLEGADWADIPGNMTHLDEKKRDAFETRFEILDDMPGYLRLAALDRGGNVLARSQVVNRHIGNVSEDLVQYVTTLMAFGALLVGMVVFVVRKRRYRYIISKSAHGLGLFRRAAGSVPSRVDIQGRYSSARGWRGWGGAKAHELQSILS
ncbi:Arylsulfotransferase-domain-containing protein [Poronia punctata]|nr:Arylsulfotransferase-domain-containing protein [Poronia punctata]